MVWEGGSREAPPYPDWIEIFETPKKCANRKSFSFRSGFLHILSDMRRETYYGSTHDKTPIPLLRVRAPTIRYPQRIESRYDLLLL